MKGVFQSEIEEWLYLAARLYQSIQRGEENISTDFNNGILEVKKGNDNNDYLCYNDDNKIAVINMLTGIIINNPEIIAKLINIVL